MADHDYDAGLRDGKLRAHEEILVRYGKVLDQHHSRITAQERITWIAVGAVLFVQLLPTLQKLIN